jgi:hypothetical protein
MILTDVPDPVILLELMMHSSSLKSSILIEGRTYVLRCSPLDPPCFLERSVPTIAYMNTC